MSTVTAEDIKNRYRLAMETLTDDQKWAVAMSEAIEFEYRDIDYRYADPMEAYTAAEDEIFAVEAENQSENA